METTDHGWFKINTNVAVRDIGSYTAMSCRDSSSSLCWIYTERFNAVNPLLGEAIAILTAMEQASQKGWIKVIFECDSLLLCNAVNAINSSSLWMIEDVVLNIQDFLSRFPF
ncbi:hypothetical protein CJ030_MR1G006387 [Morella rubra]|uniref:RNase H type-1 domain-containing protein n=1 Tax=Morella rubra TaxID=262757 RepID=A0A6A1WSY2_9ROSI|nr:hypothetical protein CJ030_MR1G006387 [Morella rubra]